MSTAVVPALCRSSSPSASTLASAAPAVGCPLVWSAECTSGRVVPSAYAMRWPLPVGEGTVRLRSTALTPLAGTPWAPVSLSVAWAPGSAVFPPVPVRVLRMRTGLTGWNVGPLAVGPYQPITSAAGFAGDLLLLRSATLPSTSEAMGTTI